MKRWSGQALHPLTTLLVLYAQLVAIVTWLPFNISVSAEEVQRKWQRLFNLGHVGSTWPDIIGNVLFFVPWGIILVARLLDGRRGFLYAGTLATAGGCLLSVTVELGQLFLPGRWAQWSDVAANSGGAFGGALIGCALIGYLRLWGKPPD